MTMSYGFQKVQITELKLRPRPVFDTSEYKLNDNGFFKGNQ